MRQQEKTVENGYEPFDPATEFYCENCHQIFTKTRIEEEVEEEAKQWTKEELAGGSATICDDCYIEFMKWIKPRRKVLRQTLT